MKDKIIKLILQAMIRIRWGYFHVSPRYMKFKMSSGSDEVHFQHIKTGEFHTNFEFANIEKGVKVDFTVLLDEWISIREKIAYLEILNEDHINVINRNKERFAELTTAINERF